MEGHDVGGTTTLWGGQALPLDTIDFSYRSWVPYSGWPLTRTELEPYYRRAEQVMHLNEIPTMSKCGSLLVSTSCLRSCLPRSAFSHLPENLFCKGVLSELKAARTVEVFSTLTPSVCDQSIWIDYRKSDIASLSNR
jgi:hypothetical protein